MKILLVNNNTLHLKELKAALAPSSIEVVMYRPGVEFNWQDKDLVVLSGGGGEGNEINDTVDRGQLWYQDEMKFVLSCPKPIVGICMGFEVIARSFGSAVEEMDDEILGFRKLTTTQKGGSRLTYKKLDQYEAHKWRVREIPSKYFEVLADSPSGIEIFTHKTRPLIATQFHPEKGGTIGLKNLLAQLA